MAAFIILLHSFLTDDGNLLLNFEISNALQG